MSNWTQLNKIAEGRYRITDIKLHDNVNIDMFLEGKDGEPGLRIVLDGKFMDDRLNEFYLNKKIRVILCEDDEWTKAK